MKWIEVDGSSGEGGGQILRTSLALSIITKKPLHIKNIRAGRAKPGLLRQHLTCVKAAQKICDAQVKGAHMESQEVRFVPGKVKAGKYSFEIGTAGSTTLVLQTILYPLLFADAPSEVSIEGGTHNMGAPPFEFLQDSFLPVLHKIGISVFLELKRPGFFPMGGGRVSAKIFPTQAIGAIKINSKGKSKGLEAGVISNNLPPDLGQKGKEALQEEFALNDRDVEVKCTRNGKSVGNAIYANVKQAQVNAHFIELGQKGVQFEKLCKRLKKRVNSYHKQKAPVDEYLADQLLIPMALAEEGSFKTCMWSSHASTNAEVIRKFTGVRIEHQQNDDRTISVEVKKRH